MGILENIKSREDIKSFNIKKIFEDDHLICVDLEINNVDIEFYYFDDIGFLYNWEFIDRSFKLSSFKILLNVIMI